MSLPVHKPRWRPKRSVHAGERHPGRRFVDLYEGNAGFDASRYALSGAPFLVHKASEGIAHTDSKHALRCIEAHKHGLAVGHYHFFRGSETGRPEIEARHFWQTVRPHFLTKWPQGRGHDLLPSSHTDFLIVDVETAGGAPLQMELTHFCRELHRVSGRNIDIGYSGKFFLKEHRLHIPGDKWWVADYPFFPGDPGEGRHLWAHQYTDHGNIPGIGQPCDTSVIVAKQSIRYWAAR